MKCKHVHKDAPENAICEDCCIIMDKFRAKLMLDSALNLIKEMKGGQNDNKNN